MRVTTSAVVASKALATAHRASRRLKVEANRVSGTARVLDAASRS